MNALVHSERVVTPTGVRAAWLRIEDGVIQGVGDTPDPPEAEHLVLDVADLDVADGKNMHDPPPGQLLRRSVIGSRGRRKGNAS